MTSSPAHGTNFEFSRQLLVTLIVASGATVALIGIIIAIAAGHCPPTPWLGIGLTSAVASWVCFFVTLCRDQVLAAINRVHDRIDEYGEQCTADGRIAAYREVTDDRPQPTNGRSPSRIHLAN